MVFERILNAIADFRAFNLFPNDSFKSTEDTIAFACKW